MATLGGLIAANYGLSYGLKSEPTFASPSVFAEAFFGFPGIVEGKSKRTVIIEILEDIIRATKDDEVDLERLPLVKHLLFDMPNASAANAYDTLRSWVLTTNNTAKLFDAPMVEVAANGKFVSRSMTQSSSLSVKSRERGESRDIVINNAFSSDELIASRAEIIGGSPHANHTTKRNALLSVDNEWDKALLDTLSPRQLGQYNRKMQNIDFTMATALTALNWASRHKKHISGGAASASGSSFLPFDYNLRRDAATEILARIYAPADVKEKMGLSRKDIPQRELDPLAYDLGVPYTTAAKKLLDSGHAAQTAPRAYRNFGRHWAIILALIKHMHEPGKDRIFRDSSREFAGTQHEINGLVYNFTPGSAHAGKDANVSAHILYGDNFGLPRVMYVSQKPKNFVNQVTPGFNPLAFTNDPHTPGRKKTFFQYDWRTNKPTQATLCDPTDQILQEAATFEANLGRFVHRPYDMRLAYLQEQFRATQSTK